MQVVSSLCVCVPASAAACQHQQPALIAASCVSTCACHVAVLPPPDRVAPPAPPPQPGQVVADINKARDEDVADIQPNLAALKPKLT